jgi:hypothetical protein
MILRIQLTHIEIQTAPANTNPLARWVEAVQPWMPGGGNEAENETPDWTARAKGKPGLYRDPGTSFSNYDSSRILVSDVGLCGSGCPKT